MTYTYCYVYSTRLLMMDRDCPKHVEFYSKNKFKELLHLVCFITRTELSIFSSHHTFSFVLDPFTLLLTLIPETSCVVFTSIFCPHLPSSTSIFHNPLPRLVWRGCHALFFSTFTTCQKHFQILF